jgi:peptide/nickel transport system permease protein
MYNYIVRRVLLMIPTLFVVTIVVFLSIRLIPGNVVELMVLQHGAEQGVGEEQLNIEGVRAMLGLDLPMHVQYGRWMAGVIRGDLGDSLWWRGRNVTQHILERLPVSFELGILAFIIAQIIAIPVGLYSAIRQDSAGDYIGRSFAIISLATPAFWLGTMIMVFPSIWWGWSPPMKFIPFMEDPLGNLGQFIIPAVLMGTAMSATTMRMLRTTMLEVLRQDYVRTAWSKGLKERIVVVRHAMRNALIPVVTIVAGQIPVMIGGAVIMEQIFSLPGMGRLFLDAIVRRDYPYVSGLNLFFATFGMILILLTDLSYAWLDPRVRYK